MVELFKVRLLLAEVESKLERTAKLSQLYFSSTAGAFSSVGRRQHGYNIKAGMDSEAQCYKNK